MMADKKRCPEDIALLPVMLQTIARRICPEAENIEPLGCMLDLIAIRPQCQVTD